MSGLALTVLLALAAFRAMHFVADDTLPLVARPREWLEGTRFGQSAWGDVFQCYWCAGAWLSIAAVWVADYYTSVPLPGLQVLAVSGLVGVGGYLVGSQEG